MTEVQVLQNPGDVEITVENIVDWRGRPLGIARIKTQLRGRGREVSRWLKPWTSYRRRQSAEESIQVSLGYSVICTILLFIRVLNLSNHPSTSLAFNCPGHWEGDRWDKEESAGIEDSHPSILREECPCTEDSHPSIPAFAYNVNQQVVCCPCTRSLTSPAMLWSTSRRVLGAQTVTRRWRSRGFNQRMLI